MTIAQPLNGIIEAFKERQPMRAKSLIITFFGDVVSQHGKQIWLGSITNALEGLGVNDRLVRTSVFRLVKEDWLDVDREGRRSFYRFTNLGSQEYQRAAERIYSENNDIWRGRWQLLMLVDVNDQARDGLRRSLNWLGFRAITPGTFARPGGDEVAVQDLLDEFGLDDGVIVMEASTSPITLKRQLRETVSERWELDALADEYSAFIKRFKPLTAAVNKGRRPTPIEAFHARLLLIHDYRRVLLRDTSLPDDLLPSRWQGTLARQLVGSLYKDLAGPSLQFIEQHLAAQQGALSGPNPAFYERFGGFELSTQ